MSEIKVKEIKSIDTKNVNESPQPQPQSQPQSQPQTQTQPQTQPQSLSPSMEYDRYFLNWLKTTRQSLVICSYKSNYIFCVGLTTLLKPEVREQLSFWMTPSSRPMTACITGDSIYVGSLNQLTKYVKYGDKKEDGTGDDAIQRTPFDGYFVPREIKITGDIDIHDIVVSASGVPYFCSALFCCVCQPSEEKSFKVFWKPDWITKIAAEDRCHLNGLCCVDGEPRYVTCIARTDVRGAWRNKRVGGGVVWDIKENKLVCGDLCMPHSPRWHNGKLWILNSGRGEFGWVDFSKTAKNEKGEEYHPFVPEVFIPGYLRGMCFTGEFAVIGSSKDRHEKTFQELPLGEKIAANGLTGKCGISVINMKRFDVVHEMSFESPINEIYDVISIPNCTRPTFEVNQPMVLAQLFDFEQ